MESPIAKVKMDIREMPFDDNSFDVLLCNHVLEHIDDELKATKEIYRVLKDDGMAIVSYHGILARGCHQYNSKMRKLIVPKSSKKFIKKVQEKEDGKTHKTAEQAASRDEIVAPLTWAQRLKRVFNMTRPPRPQPPPIKTATAS